MHPDCLFSCALEMHILAYLKVKFPHIYHVALVCNADVLALASALCQLGACLRTVRTALWCALQLTCADLPAACIRLARQTANRHVVLAMHHGRAKPHTAEFWEYGDELLSDGDEIPEEDETGAGETREF